MNNFKMIDVGSLPRTTELAERFMYPFSQLNFLLNGGIFGRVVLISSFTNAGKAQPLYSKIMSPNGEIAMGKIKVGDDIFDINGGLQKVIGIYPQGKKQIYRLWTSDGVYADCIDEHLWTVIDTHNKNKEVTLKTLDIINNMNNIKNDYKNRFRYGLPEYKALNYSTKNFECDPYVMGAYIGNGCSSQRQFSISSGSEDVIQEIARKLNTKYRRVSLQNYTYTFYQLEKYRQIKCNNFLLTRNIIPKELLGKKSYEKFIPNEYFYGDIKQRWDLLKGLMDTDGTVHITKDKKSINTIYSTSSEQLAKDICELVYSLGYIANVKVNKRHNRICRPEYSINIRINKNENPFLIERKASKWRPAKMNKYRKIVKIEKLDLFEETQCIKVSSNEELYLTDHCIVTHNTTLTSQILESVIQQDYKVGAFFGEDSLLEARDRIYKQSTSYNSSNISYKVYEQNGKQTNTGEYILSQEAFEIAQRKFSNKFFLFPIDFGAKVDEILEAFDKLIIEKGVKVFVLDNADQFEFSSENENKAMRDIQIKIRNFAIQKNVLIFLIAHTRKIERDVLLPDLNDVKGTSALVNIARDVIIIIRMDKIDRTTKTYKGLVSLLKQNNYDIEEKDKDGNYKVDAILYVPKTKGRKLGFVCLGFNRITQTYYEVKKIDEKVQESNRSNVIPENATLLEVSGQEFKDIDALFGF